MSFNWKALLGTAAPLIGTALGGPFGAIAGKLLGQAIDPSGKTDGSDPEALQKGLVAGLTDPAAIERIVQAENDFKLSMAKLGYDDAEKLAQLQVDMLAADNADRASARGREETVRDYTTRILAYFVTCGFFGLLGFMLTHQVPAENRDLLDVMLGSLGSAWIAIVSYYFGSSSGSDRKTELMAKSQSDPNAK